MPLNFMLGWKLTELTVISAEFGIPIIKDFPVYTFKTQLSMGFCFRPSSMGIAAQAATGPSSVSSSRSVNDRYLRQTDIGANHAICPLQANSCQA